MAKRIGGPPGGFATRLAARSCVYPAALLVLCAAHIIFPRRSGVLALTAVLAPYLFLPLLVHAPFVMLRGTWLLRLLLVASALVFATRLGPRLPARTLVAAPDGDSVEVLSLNVRFDGGDTEVLRRFVESGPAAIVVLQEDYLVWYDADYATWRKQEEALARAYPHQVRLNSAGLTILSVYPVIARMSTPRSASLSPVLWARLDLGAGRTLVVATAHPRNALRSGCSTRYPVCFNTMRRDAEVAEVRSVVETFLRDGEPIILLGDFNLTDREPAYRDLVAGLRDAYRVVGAGMGHTWGPVVRGRLVPLLRIDYLFVGPGVTPLRLTVDCTPVGSDHCALRGTLHVR